MYSSTLRKNLAANLRTARVAKGWSQEELAAKAGLHRTYVGSVERGERNVTLATVELLAAALTVDPLRLLQEATNSG